MKKINILLTIIFAISLLTSCESIKIDNNEPQVYIPHNWVSINKIWERTDNVYTANIKFYCSGILPSNQNSEINIDFEVAPSLIQDYNNDNTQEFAGDLELLPSDCYKIGLNQASIAKGKVETTIPIVFDISKVKQACSEPNKMYAVPIRLTNTDKYQLHEDPVMITAFYCVNVNMPEFLFYVNRDGVTDVSTNLIYGREKEVKYDIISKGVPDGKYKINIDVNEDALKARHHNAVILPEDAYSIENKELLFSNNENCTVNVKYDYSKLEFGTDYYLPISIVSTSEYAPDSEKGNLFVKLKVINEYEKQYQSKMSIACEKTGSSKSYSVTKEIVSCDKDIIELQIITNKTIAGSTYNNKYVRIKVIPTDDKSKYNIEYIPITGTPNGLEAIPDADNYYDWNMERFVLSYRWKDKYGKWITAVEIVEAK